MTPPVRPIVFSPSQEWDGNDGKWSSFVIRVGTPAQDFRVFPALADGEAIIPLPQGCPPDWSPECGRLRGVYPFEGVKSNGFLANKSSTWKEIGLFEVNLRPKLNVSGSGIYGLDTIGLMVQNAGGPTLDGQTIAGISTRNIYVGLLGLSPKPVNFSSFDHPQPVLLRSLKEGNLIPSLSYGYTAGAYYKSPRALGSLTLGGYDRSKFEPNNVTFPFDSDDNRPTSLNIESILARDTLNGLSINLLPRITYVRVDPTVPHLWLPLDACYLFESAFGLIYDNSTDLYLVNNSIHDELLLRNPTVTIGLGNDLDPAEKVNIVLPYSAFDLQASEPIYPNATNYFPIRRAYNESQYNLGRTFFQEAFMIVDHERQSFSVHQARFPPLNTKADIVALLSPGETKSIHIRRITGGLIAGIVVGGLIVVLLFSILIAYVVVRRRRVQNQMIESVDQHAESEKPEMSNGDVYELHQSVGSEIEGNQMSEMSHGDIYELHESVGCEVAGNPVSELPADVPSTVHRARADTTSTAAKESEKDL